MVDRRNSCYLTKKRSEPTRKQEDSGRLSKGSIQIATRQHQPCMSAKNKRPLDSAHKVSASSQDSVTIQTAIAIRKTMKAGSTTTATCRVTCSIPTQMTPQTWECTRKRTKRSNMSTSSMVAPAGAALKKNPRSTPIRSQRNLGPCHRENGIQASVSASQISLAGNQPPPLKRMESLMKTLVKMWTAKAR